MNTKTNGELMKVSAVATWLDSSEQTVLNWIAEGKLRGYRLSRRTILVDATSVRELLARTQIGAGAVA